MAEKIEKRSVSVRIDGKEIENSYKAIMKEVSALRNENQKLAEDTEGYVRKALSLAQASEAAQKNRDSVKAIAEAWKAMPEDVRQSVIEQQTALLKLREDFGKLMEGGENTKSPAMKAMKAQIQELQAEIVKTTQTYVELQKPAINSITAIEKEIAKLKGEMEKAELETDQYRQKMSRWQELTAIVEKHKNDLKGIEPAVKGSLEALEGDIKEVENALSKSVLKSKEYYENIKRLDKLNADLDEHKKEIGQIENAWYKNIPAIKEFAAVAVGALAIDSIVSYGQALFKTGVEMDNIARKSVIVLKEQLGFVNAEAKKNAEEIGLAREQYVGLATDVTTFLQSQKFSRAEAAKMSTEVVNLTGVLAQFQGGGLEKTEEALEAIKGAFAEDVEQLAKFNIAISENVVQAKMQELGLDKANAAAQQHGRGMIILKMIMEGAKAQNEAFTGSAEGMVRAQARIDAMLQSISNNLAKFFIPLFEKTLSLIAPLVVSFGYLASELGGMSNRVQESAQAFDEQKNNVADLTKNINPLLTQYDNLTSKSKLTNKEQAQLKDITQKIGEVIPIAANAFNDYGVAMSVNTKIARDYIETEKVRLKYLNEIAIVEQRNALFQMESQRDILAAQLENKKTSRIVDLNTMATVEQDIDNETLKKTAEALNLIQKRIDGANAQIRYLSGENIKTPVAPDVVDMSGVSLKDQQEKKKKEDEEKKHLEKLRELLKAHLADISAQEQREDERDAERIREKYRKDIEAATDLEKSKQSKVAKGAHDVRLALEDALSQELAAKQIENTEKRLAKLKEIETAAIAAVKTLKADGLDTELAAITAKYDAKIAEIKKIVGTDDNAKGRGQSAIEAVEAERENAVIETKNKFNDKLVAQIQAFQNEVFQLHADDEERELASLEVRYNELMIKAQKFHEGEMDVIKWYEEQKTKIKEEAENKRTKATESSLKKQAEIEKKLADGQTQLAESKLQTMKNFADIVQTILGDTAKKSTAFVLLTKGIAAAELFFQAQREIAGYYAAYAAIPGGPAIATGLAVQAKIRTAVGIAAILARAIPEVTQKDDGGPVEVVGASDGKTYRPRYRGQATSGMYYEPSLFLAAENKPEYVIAYPEMQNPLVANFLPVIEGIRQRRMVRGYDDGGVTSGEVQAQGVAQQQPNAISMPVEMFNMFMVTMSNVNNALEKGIILTYEDVEHIDKMRKSIQAARGYS